MWIEDLEWIEADETIDGTLGGVRVRSDGESVSARESAALSRLLPRLDSATSPDSSA